MSNLYNELATVYEAMYQTFIDYEQEYIYYSDILKKYKKQQVLEIGCGTGHLANYFQKHGFDYIGLDFSEEMIQLGKVKAPTCEFLQGDMRDFELGRQLQSIIITARTTSYLRTNKDINAAFSAINKNLQTGGILCFDFIDANQFIPDIVNGKEVVHNAIYQNKAYVRKSFWQAHLVDGMDFKWQSTYYKKEDEQLIEIGQDNSIIRTFTLNEMELFLAINGFAIKEIVERASYAFPTYVVVAEKNTKSILWTESP